MTCETCGEPTRRPAGLYDREMEDGTLQGGFFYTCKSKTCPVALESKAAYEWTMEKARKTRQINAARGIETTVAVYERKSAGITGLAMARRLGVDPTSLCDWEQGREPWPKDIYKKYWDALIEAERASDG